MSFLVPARRDEESAFARYCPEAKADSSGQKKSALGMTSCVLNTHGENSPSSLLKNYSCCHSEQSEESAFPFGLWKLKADSLRQAQGKLSIRQTTSGFGMWGFPTAKRKGTSRWAEKKSGRTRGLARPEETNLERCPRLGAAIRGIQRAGILAVGNAVSIYIVIAHVSQAILV